MASKKTKTKSTKKTATKAAIPEIEHDGKNIRRSDLIALIVFSVMVIATGAITLMLTLGKVTVTITPKTETIPLQATLTLNVDTTPTGPLNVSAVRLPDQTKTVTKTFSVPAGTMAPAKASGTVTIFNDGGAAQALAAQTRLQYSDGKIFRIQNRVTAPAHGSVDVTVIADEAGKQGEVAPGDWIIPGLRAANQKIIYGKNTAAITGGEVSSQQVTQELVDQAQQSMLADLIASEKQTNEQMLPLTQSSTPQKPVVVTIKTANASATSSPAVGTNASEYAVTLNATLQEFFVVRDDLTQFAQTAITNSSDPASSYKIMHTQPNTDGTTTSFDGNDVPLKSIDTTSLQLTLDNVNADGKTADATLSFAAEFAPQNFDITNIRRTLVGKSEIKALQLLNANPNIADAKITFAKFFPKMMPSIPTLITVKIQQ